MKGSFLHSSLMLIVLGFVITAMSVGSIAVTQQVNVAMMLAFGGITVCVLGGIYSSTHSEELNK